VQPEVVRGNFDPMSSGSLPQGCGRTQQADTEVAFKRLSADAPAVQGQCKRAGKTLGGHLVQHIWSVNVGGSREALLHSFGLEGDILLLQEHCLPPTAIHGAQCLAAQQGWHGLWDAAEVTKQGGRSGGTAVLVRKPLLIYKGKDIPKATSAIVPWTRTTCLHVFFHICSA